MLVVTLALAAVGFALLVVALMTGSVVWAWGCIVVCVIGAVLLLVSALAQRRPASGDRDRVPRAARRPVTGDVPTRKADPRQSARLESNEFTASIRPSPGSLRKNGRRSPAQ